MADKVLDGEFFHVSRDLPYNQLPLMTIGTLLEAGRAPNPFFGYYEDVRNYPVTTPEGVVHHVPAIKFLKSISRGEINCVALPQIAAEIAEHYLILAREVIMEEVRREIAPDAPSRQSCLWLADTLDEAQAWLVRLGGSGRIARLKARGIIHRADAALLLGDSEPLSKTYDHARSYWKGNHSKNAAVEILFSGSAEVIDFL